MALHASDPGVDVPISIYADHQHALSIGMKSRTQAVAETRIGDGDQCAVVPPSIFTVFLHFPMFPILSPPRFLSVYSAATSLT